MGVCSGQLGLLLPDVRSQWDLRTPAGESLLSKPQSDLLMQYLSHSGSTLNVFFTLLVFSFSYLQVFVWMLRPSMMVWILWLTGVLLCPYPDVYQETSGAPLWLLQGRDCRLDQSTRSAHWSVGVLPIIQCCETSKIVQCTGDCDCCRLAPAGTTRWTPWAKPVARECQPVLNWSRHGTVAGWPTHKTTRESCRSSTSVATMLCDQEHVAKAKLAYVGLDTPDHEVTRHRNPCWGDIGNLGNLFVTLTLIRIHPNLRSVVYCSAIGAGGVVEWDFGWRMFKNASIAIEADKLRAALACASQPWLLNRWVTSCVTSCVLGPEVTCTSL